MPIAALLLLAESLSHKLPAPANQATLKTDTPLFTGITAVTILILSALTFLPILVLGSIAEAFKLTAEA